MSLVASLDIAVKGNTTGLDTTFKKAEGSIKGFAGKVESLGGSDFGLAGYASKFASAFTNPVIAGIAGVTAAVGGLIFLTKNSFSGIGETGKLASRLGMRPEDIQALEVGLAKTGGDIEHFEHNVSHLAKAIGEAKMGDTAMVKNFNELGITFEQLNSQSPKETIDAIAEGIKNINDPMKQAAITSKLAGRGYEDLLKLLKGGKAGLAAFGEEAKRLGLDINANEIQTVKEAKIAWSEMSLAWRGAGNQLAVAVAPIVKQVGVWLTDGIVAVGKVINYSIPIVKSFFDLWKSGWKVFLDFTGISGVADALAGILPSMNDFSSRMGEFRHGILTIVYEIEYAFQHWQKGTVIAFDGIVLAATEFKRNLEDTFKKDSPIPALVGEQLNIKLAQLRYNLTGTTEDLKKLRQEEKNYQDMVSANQNYKFKPISDFEKNLAAKHKADLEAWNKASGQFVEEKVKMLEAIRKPSPELAKVAADFASVTKGTPALLRGSAAAYSAIASAQGSEMAKGINKQIEQSKAIVTELQNIKRAIAQRREALRVFDF